MLNILSIGTLIADPPEDCDPLLELEIERRTAERVARLRRARIHKGGRVLLAVDPGTAESGWCLFDGSRVLESGVAGNPAMIERIGVSVADELVIEMVASYGMPVGREVFETVRWIGRMQQAWRDPDAVRLVYRGDVKLHLCGTPRAKDPNIRQALIDRLGPVGAKKCPGPLYGVKSHAWSALAVAVTAHKGGDALRLTRGDTSAGNPVLPTNLPTI